MENIRFELAARPVGMIKESDFKRVEEAKPSIEDGQFLVRQVYMSLDPAMRGWMNESKDSYIPPVEIGETMRAWGVGVIEESKNEKFPVGAQVSGMLGWTKYVAMSGEGVSVLPDLGIPFEVYMGVLGLPGVTAYYGLMDIGQPKKGETLLVSGAAGSVGSIVGQIGKAEGMRVIGVAGTDEKCQWLKDELGFDEAINYKTEDIAAKVKEYAPEGVDVYFENVGGQVLEAAMFNMRTNGRIVMCGMISEYNNTELAKGPNLLRMIMKRLRMQGFAVTDIYDRFGEFAQKVGAYLMQDQIKFRLDIVDGLENAPTAINKLFDGSNKGKLVIKVSDL